MRVPGGRRGAVISTVVALILIVAVIGPATTAASAPPGLKQFMWAMGQVESGGNYTARNPSSGAYGKYQIMPANWPSWAKAYLGDAKAKQTPANQEKVAAGKMTALYRSLGSWRRVAYWWLTGSSRKTGWSAYATRYVNKVMRLYAEAPATGGGGGGGGGTAAKPAVKRYGDGHDALVYRGSWKTAGHQGYSGDKVHYSTAAGASVQLTFTGTQVVWYGPVGPTRGKAKVFLDGRYIKTIDLRRGGFDARNDLFRFTWRSKGKHTIKVVVVGTSGRPMVAIDEFAVRQ